MAKKKAGGTSKNLRDSQPKYLGVKRADGQMVKTGEIIVRQRGTKIEAGKGVKVASDHTIFAMTDGVVSFGNKRKITFTGATVAKKVVHVLPATA
jgi:large subunit ribosomal protein L27